MSLARFDSRQQRTHTPYTFVMFLLSVFPLMAGAVMYGLAVMGLDRGRTDLAYWDVTEALLNSFLIALEKSVREAGFVEPDDGPRYVGKTAGD